MNYSRTAAMQPKAVSAGMLLLVGGAFALIQLTSLVLGPAPSRQLHLSLAMPAVDLEDMPKAAGPLDTVLGAVIEAATPDARPSSGTRLAHSSATQASTYRLLSGQAVVKGAATESLTTPVVAATVVTPTSSAVSAIVLSASSADQAGKQTRSGYEDLAEAQHADKTSDRERVEVSISSTREQSAGGRD